MASTRIVRLCGLNAVNIDRLSNITYTCTGNAATVAHLRKAQAETEEETTSLSPARDSSLAASLPW